MNRVQFPYDYIPDKSVGRPLFDADLYFGIVDLDPQIPANQIDVYGKQEDGTTVLLPQPISTSAGGIPVYSGSPVELLVDGLNYSFKALSRTGSQIYYAENVSSMLTADLYPSIPTPIQNVSLIPTTDMGVDQIFELVEYYSGTKKGGGLLKCFAGAITPDNITTFSGPTGFYLARVSTDIIPEHAGVRQDGSDDSAAYERYYAYRRSGLNKFGALNLPSTNIREVADAVIYGEGTSNLYRKPMIDFYVSKSDYHASADVVAGKHIKWGCQVDKPTVMLIGDSIASYQANSITRGDMLVECLREALDKQFPQGVNFYNRSIPGANYAALFSNASSPNIPWYTTNTVNWITDTYNAVLPDIVFISFGMNDGSSLGFVQIKNAIDFYQSRAKPCSIVICTNLVPRIVTVNVSPGGEQAAMDGRDYAAGLLRTYAKYRDVGVLDFHRQLCRVQDGFDPANTVFKTTPAITGAPFGGGQTIYVSPETCNDWAWGLRFDDSAGGTLSGGIVLDFTNGFIQLTRTGSDLGVALYLDATLVFGVTIPVTFANTTDYNLHVERKNGRLIIYQRKTAPTYGAFMEPVFDQKIPYMGGLSVNSARGVNLLDAVFYKGEYVTNKPSAYNAQIWNSEASDQGYGGSGFNHPSNWVASHVYRPVIDSTVFYTYVKKYAPNTGYVGETLTASLASGSAVTLTTSVNAQVLTLALPPGTWKVQGLAAYIPAGGVNVASLKQGSSTGGTSFDFFGSWNQQGDLGAITIDQVISIPDAIHVVTNTPTTTVGLVCRAAFTVGTLKAYGYLSAVRMVER